MLGAMSGLKKEKKKISVIYLRTKGHFLPPHEDNVLTSIPNPASLLQGKCTSEN